MRASAAEARALVPFGEALANKHFAGEGCFECTVRNAAKELHNCYRCLSKDTVNRDSLLPQSCKRFCLLYISLEALARDSGEDKSWVVKPKLHWFQELCERGSTANRPTATWNYRDEDFGGSVGGLAKRRGGSHNVTSVGRQMLDRFRARYPVLRLS